MNRKRDEKGHFLPTHNMRNTRLYKTWESMKARCYNHKNKSFKNYGNRGIVVCNEWKDDFLSFYNWAINNGYKDNLTIDRIDNDGNYTPKNCRWVDHKTQNRNYRKNHFIEYNGKTMCIKSWSEETGITASTILYRIKNGKSLEEIFEKRDRRFINGK